MLELLFFFSFLMSFFTKFSLEFTFSSLLPFSLSFVFDRENLMFFSTVMIIYLSINKYSKSYMSSEKNAKRFMLLLFFFVSSMVVLIFSGSIFTSFIGWDLLGLSSLLLILFYQSFSSLKAMILTFMMNRIGDCFFLISMVYFLLISLNCMFLTTDDYFFNSSSIFFLLTGLTKSAQIPFSAWLPAAMAAPTPVSSLVHSSTLVTAGFYMLLRYFNIWASPFMLDMLFFTSISTAIMASMAAMVEMDLKKVIALSTLSHLGFMMAALGNGLLIGSFFYMIMHAFFKALLFMSAGFFIHLNSYNQDIRKLQSLGIQNPVSSTVFCFSLLSMSGFPFLTGFFSKDLVLDEFSIFSISLFKFILVFLAAIFTMIYSFRMAFFLFPMKKAWQEVSDDSLSFLKSMMPLLICTIFAGNWVSWTYLSPEFFINNSKNWFFILVMLVAYMWKYNFFYKKSNFFFKEMWYTSFISSFFMQFFFLITNKIKIYEDLHGYQGFLISLKNFYMKKSHLKKLSSFFSGNVEMFIILFIAFLALTI